MQVSNSVLDAMGFAASDEPVLIRARFFSLHVFAIEGVTLSEDEVFEQTVVIDGHSCRLAVAKSANAASRALTREDVADDEGKWAQSVKATGPWAAILIGPSDEYVKSVRRAKDERDGIVTYGEFDDGKHAVRELVRPRLPRLVTALRCAIASRDRPVELRQVLSQVFGRTGDGRFIRDVRLQMSATLTVNRQASASQLTLALDDAATIANALDGRAAAIHFAASAEPDRVRQFLGCFSAIELAIAKHFAGTAHGSKQSALESLTKEAPSLAAYLDLRNKQWSPTEKLAWLSYQGGLVVTPDDVAEFKRLKRIRVDLAHGIACDATPEEVQSVRQLAAVLLKGLALA